jgi:hypothetical protein
VRTPPSNRPRRSQRRSGRGREFLKLCRALIYFCLSFVSDFYRAVKIDSIDDSFLFFLVYFVAISRCDDRFIDDKGVPMDYEEIHLEAVRRAKHWHHAELELVEILQLVNKELVWKKKKYTSLFMYAVGALEIPPEHVYRLSGVSKACNDVPELKEALTQGLLSVSEASRLVPVITQENAKKSRRLTLAWLPAKRLKLSMLPKLPLRSRSLTKPRIGFIACKTFSLRNLANPAG